MLRLSTKEDLRTINAIGLNLLKDIFVIVVNTWPNEKSQNKVMLEFSLKPLLPDIKRMLGTIQTSGNILPSQLASREIILLLGL
jgi:hypothetical protein